MNGLIISQPELQADDHYLMRIHAPLENISPGQFVSLRAGAAADPLLRRPFSVFDYHDDTVEIIFHIVGKATAIFSQWHNNTIDILGPLGKGFTILKDKRVLLIGGGAGNAPLHYLARTLKKENCSVTQVYGSRSRSLIFCKDRFCSFADDIVFTTDDGSEGEKGFVTDVARRLLSQRQYDMVYTCGPLPMVKALLPLIETHGLPCEVSLENYFGCGTGLCYGCTIRTREGNRRVCADGPVFNLEMLDYSLLT